ncbi:MAG TPA: TIGR03085 family metal-binding protein [Intrasporangium sp.]|uniref:TIGR03085 family metal-binding protein n=1 Tax=Intrasporangium sp. TaxID=1925024 RepID=UPI002D794109|nr:TIGR03085 family metal-binding protein [Intrasporangium sp.]HET7400076.1 TIGR03085 family metal-binding protein [Intrasporangium sp.]
MTRHAASERQLLCDELERLGPDAPTMCEGWATRDLAAHLHLREARPDLALGVLLPPLRGRLERERRSLVGEDYRKLMGRLRGGPPVWSLGRLPAVDERLNLTEYFVHLEDVRRAQPGWEPRRLGVELQSTLWRGLRRSARLMFRRAPTGVVLIADGHGRYAAKSPGERGTVIVRGEPAELVLFAFGRTTVAQVDLQGDPDDVAALREARLGV